MGWGSDFINDDAVPVSLTFNDDTFTVTADTLNGHMLEGQRNWTVMMHPSPCGCKVWILTWTYDRKVGLLNDWGAWALGTNNQAAVWEQYLKNIVDAYDGASVDMRRTVGDTGSTSPPY